MLSGIIAYQVLRQENPATIDKVKAMLEKHPWYANQWQARLQDVAICLALIIIGNENVCAKTRKSDESCGPISN
jgi:primosomal replication protein N